VLKAIGYARISKDDTLEGRGVARQTEDIAAVCDRHGWELGETITDNDISASR
jgi:site-specific DNA recombinase